MFPILWNYVAVDRIPVSCHGLCNGSVTPFVILLHTYRPFLESQCAAHLLSLTVVAPQFIPYNSQREFTYAIAKT